MVNRIGAFSCLLMLEKNKAGTGIIVVVVLCMVSPEQYYVRPGFE